MILFNRSVLRPGLIVSVRTRTFFGNLIHKVLTPSFNELKPAVDQFFPECPTHDAITVEHKGEIWIGESVPLRAKLTSLDEYEKHLADGTYKFVTVWKASRLNQMQEMDAAEAWKKYIKGTFYDFMAFPRLWIKNTIIDLFDVEIGWEWAHWCTEGVAKSFILGPKYDVYGKINPTPFTTVKRAVQGILTPVSEAIIVAD